MNYFNPIGGVVNLHEKCHASCCRHLDHACDYSEPYSMSCQAMVQMSCNVNQNDVAMDRDCPSTQIAQKRQCRPKKTWDELFRDGRKKLGIDLTTLKTGLNRRGYLRGRLVNPQMRKMDYKLDIMIV